MCFKNCSRVESLATFFTRVWTLNISNVEQTLYFPCHVFLCGIPVLLLLKSICCIFHIPLQYESYSCEFSNHSLIKTGNCILYIEKQSSQLLTPQYELLHVFLVPIRQQTCSCNVYIEVSILNDESVCELLGLHYLQLTAHNFHKEDPNTKGSFSFSTYKGSVLILQIFCKTFCMSSLVSN